ncbi:helix-turn-helix transcriptional regulator [Streptomyces sp. NPDC004610]|uniref:helix-turn-helix domain-containing protein n=1 Tax=unclassified Streptomyces TaxID=2593676 RepID=UPI0033AF7836
MSEGTGPTGFAELLRELKERSGLSYGVLAKRLHMSTSTLHRYCNGDAVPADYAPVERFARLCRAAPEELVELHRRWVLADAMRGSGAKKGTGGTGTEVREEAEAGGAEVAVELAGPPVPSVSAGRARWLRRRTVVLAGVALAGVLGAVAFAVGLPSEGAGRDGGAVGAPGVGGGSGEPSGSGSHSVSASPSASPSPSASVSASGSGPPSVAVTPGGGGAASGGTVDAGPPLTVATRPHTWEGPCSQHYLIDREPADVGPPPVEQDAPAWVGAYRAVSAGEQLLSLTVQGTGADTVVVEGLTVRVVGRDTPLAWNDYVMGVGCGGDVPVRPFSVALDGARPEVVAGAGQRDFPFKVSESDPEVFEITADASAYDVSWYLELRWSSGERTGTVVVDDGGRPFRTSGNNGRPGYQFPLGGEEWVDAVDGTEGDGEGP